MNSDSRITVRPATSGDLPRLVEGNLSLAAESESKSLDGDRVYSGVQEILTDPNKGRYFVALCDGTFAGQTLITFEWSDWRNGRFWWLQSVYVWPDYRRRGVFRALFGHISGLANASNKVCGLRLYVEHENHSARSTYQRLGMVDAGYTILETDWSDAGPA